MLSFYLTHYGGYLGQKSFKKFWSLLGQRSFKKKCFWDFLTFNKHLKDLTLNIREKGGGQKKGKEKRYLHKITYKFLLDYSDIYRRNLDTVQYFLIKLGIKPRMHVWEISIFSLNDVIVRHTKIMNRADKNWAHF